MALPVLVIGRSGSGKTYSLKNFKADEVGVISVEKGRLPFYSVRRKDEFPIAVWINNQKNRAKHGMLTDGQIRRLRELNIPI